MEKKQVVKCGLYTRVSSRNQLAVEYNSLQTQRERLESYCKSQEGFEIYRVYEEAAYSAATLDRPKLHELLRDIEAGKINCVLAYKIDRLARSTKDFYSLLDLFNRHGVTFISVTQQFDTNGPIGRLVRNILLGFAEFERDITADRTRDKMFQRAQKGLWNGGNVPYGYTNDNKQLAIDAKEAEVVQFIFEHFDKNRSITRLREELRARNLNHRNGKPWGKTSVIFVLKNPIYAGLVRCGTQLFEGVHKPIIDRALFERVQSIVPERTHARVRIARTYLLKGLLKCGQCGSVMTPHYTQKRRKDGSSFRVPYYRCTKTFLHGKEVCSIRQVNADQIEGAVVADLADLAQRGSLLEQTIAGLNRDRTKQLAPLEKEAVTVKKAISEAETRMKNYAQALGRAEISLDVLEQEVAETKQTLAGLRHRYEEIRNKLDGATIAEYNAELVLNTLKDFGTVFSHLTRPEQAEALQYVLQNATLYTDRIVLNIFELEEFRPGSQNRTDWLPGLDSNRRRQHSAPAINRDSGCREP